MKVEECVNVHSLCLKMRIRVLEEKNLIYPHYGVWGRHSMVLELLIAKLGLDGTKLQLKGIRIPYDTNILVHYSTVS